MVVAAAVVAFAGLIGTAAPSRAQTAAERTLARQLFRDGVAAARQSRWADACGSFQRAYDLVGEPEVLLNLAGAQAETAQLVESAESYRRFLREVTSGSLARQRPQAERLLAEIEPRIPSARISANGLLAGDSMTLDGTELARATLGADLPVNPGSHVLVVTRHGAEVGRRSFTAVEGSPSTVEMQVTAPSARANALPTPTPQAAHADVLSPEQSSAVETDDEGGGGGVFASPVFWLVVGLVVVGGATATVLVLTRQTPTPFSGNLGPGLVVVE